jgi:hypothetical protein
MHCNLLASFVRNVSCRLPLGEQTAVVIHTLFLSTDERGHQTLEGLLTQEACDAAVVQHAASQPRCAFSAAPIPRRHRFDYTSQRLQHLSTSFHAHLACFATRQPLWQCSRWCSTLPTLVPACRMARATMTAKRHHHQSKADKTPQQGKNHQAKDSDKHSLTCISHLSRHSLVAVLP